MALSGSKMTYVVGQWLVYLSSGYQKGLGESDRPWVIILLTCGGYRVNPTKGKESCGLKAELQGIFYSTHFVTQGRSRWLLWKVFYNTSLSNEWVKLLLSLNRELALLIKWYIISLWWNFQIDYWCNDVSCSLSPSALFGLHWNNFDYFNKYGTINSWAFIFTWCLCS